MTVRTCVARGAAACLLLGCWAGAARPLVAQQVERCPVERAEAEDHYLYGRFDQAISLLQACVDREELSSEESIRIYRLLALAYLNKGNVERARAVVATLLQTAPAYTADPVQDPPSYTAIVEDVKAQRLAEAPPVSDPEDASDENPKQAATAQRETSEEPTEGEREGAREAPPEDRPAPPPLLPDETISPDDQQAQQPRLFSSPKPWLMATGGAAVLFTAVALALGGG